jgi:hypothetical protein
MFRTNLLFIAVVGGVLAGQYRFAAAESIIRATPLGLITPGTRIDAQKNVGDGSQLVLLANPRVGAGDISSASEKVRGYASMFCMVLLAKVDKNDAGEFQLANLTVGNCVSTGSGWTVVSADSHKEHNVQLDFVARQVLSRSEKNLQAARVVAKSDAFRIFDAEAIVRDGNEHVPMKIRHLVWVNKTSGKLAMMVWLLHRNASGWQMVEDVFHALPPKYLEDRVFSVKADEITFGIPSEKALAINGLPRGKEIAATASLKKLAAAESYSDDTQKALVAELNEAIHKVRRK